MEKVYIKIIDEGLTYDCEPTVEDVVNAIIKEYIKFDVEIHEILNSIEIHGLSILDTIRVYSAVYAQIEDDIVIRISDGTKITKL